MKVAVVLVALLAALASSKEADDVFLKRQRDVLRLLFKIGHPSVSVEVRVAAKAFDVAKSVHLYQDAEVVHRFLDFYRRGRFLRCDEQFLPSSDEHMHQLRLVFDLLYFAKDYDTFYKAAAWARESLNQAQFYYAFAAAVFNRQDTRNIVLPPDYGTWPQLFVHADVIQKAYDATVEGLTFDENHPYVVYANYTGYPAANHPEELVSYFREDVGLSAFYSHLFSKAPAFLSHVNFTGNPQNRARGVRFYSCLQFLLARYDMERLSNGLPFVEPVGYFAPIDVGYYPQLRFHSGVEALFRPEGTNTGRNWNIKKEYLVHTEWRIHDAIDYQSVMDRQHQFIALTKDKAVEILANIVEGNSDSVNSHFYGHLLRDMVIAFSRTADERNQYPTSPSVLEFTETSLRDPLYYRILARVFTIFKHYFYDLPPYTKHDLEHPEFKITNLTVDNIVTYFDDFDLSIANAISVKSIESKDLTHVVARTRRLNHKRFHYKVTVDSAKDAHVIVRVFYGPRFDYLGREMSFEEQRKRFHLFDRFDHKLRTGENKIKRCTEHMAAYSESAASGNELWNRTEQALKGVKPFVVEEFLRLKRFPRRLAVPKGTREGMPLRFFVFVTPVKKRVEDNVVMTFSDGEVLNYPFERRVFDFDLEVPNARFADAVVFHRPTEDRTV